jgi:hypothetical protein
VAAYQGYLIICRVGAAATHTDIEVRAAANFKECINVAAYHQEYLIICSNTKTFRVQ